MKRILAASLLVLCTTLAWGFGAGGGGDTSKLFTIFDNRAICDIPGVTNSGISDATGYTSLSATLTPGEKTFIQLVVGDSISSNSGASAYTNTHPTKNQMLNFYNGTTYQYQDPYFNVSTGPGSYPGRIADKLITAGKFARVITIGASLGGACSSNYALDGGYNHRARVGCLESHALGWPISGSGDSGNWKFGIIYALGVNDNAQSRSPASFTANALSFQQSMRDYGCTGDIFIAKQTMLNSVVNAGIQGAQAGLVDNPNGRFVGADADSLPAAANRPVDGTHFGDVGNDNLAQLWSNIFVAHY